MEEVKKGRAQNSLLSQLCLTTMKPTIVVHPNSKVGLRVHTKDMYKNYLNQKY